MRGEASSSTQNGAGGPDGADTAATAVEAKPLNGVALAKEVVLDRLQNLLEWLLRRLKRYREGRGDWWEK